jgi:predicted branched-subunit amino acid permease
MSVTQVCSSIAGPIGPRQVVALMPVSAEPARAHPELESSCLVRPRWERLRDVLSPVTVLVPIAAAMFVGGAAFGSEFAPRNGAASVISWSAMVFAGASQYAVFRLVDAGTAWPAAVAIGLLLNARFVPIGIAIGDDAPRRGRMFAAHLLGDHSLLARSLSVDRLRGAQAYVVVGLTGWVCWIGGSACGALLPGVGLGPASGLDVVLPAMLACTALGEFHRAPGLPNGVGLTAAALATVGAVVSGLHAWSMLFGGAVGFIAWGLSSRIARRSERHGTSS